MCHRSTLDDDNDDGGDNYNYYYYYYHYYCYVVVCSYVVKIRSSSIISWIIDVFFLFHCNLHVL